MSGSLELIQTRKSTTVEGKARQARPCMRFMRKMRRTTVLTGPLCSRLPMLGRVSSNSATFINQMATKTVRRKQNPCQKHIHIYFCVDWAQVKRKIILIIIMFLTFKLYLPNDWHSFHLLWRYTVRLKVEAGTPYKKNIHINNLTYMVDACITLDQNAWIYLKICSIKQHIFLFLNNKIVVYSRKATSFIPVSQNKYKLPSFKQCMIWWYNIQL